MKAELLDGDAPGVAICRARGGPLRVQPATIELSERQADGEHLRLSAPPGWRAEPLGPRRWRVWPVSFDPGETPRFTLKRLDRDGRSSGRMTLVVPLTLDLTSDFDPAASALLVPNRAASLGERPPRRDLFRQTWPGKPARMARLLFGGLYSDIVFLSSGPRRGGLCSGMARWAIARALGDEPAPASVEAAIERITVYHGRQLNDRALLSALPWFLRGSPSAAYRAVRRDLLTRGFSDRALDLAVPKPWRRDLLQALVAEGHTVVPVRLEQPGARAGSIEVYDPNHPEAVGTAKPRRIEFDLQRDSYAYGTLVAMDQTNVGIIAVRQTAYASSGSTVLATLGSLLFAPRRALRSLYARASWRD